jgi:hypothetical protein
MNLEVMLGFGSDFENGLVSRWKDEKFCRSGAN